MNFTIQLQQNKRLIYGIISKYCRDEKYKDDLFQDVSLQAWQAYGSFKEHSKFSSWIGKIARNVAISDFRKAKLKTILVDNFLWEVSADTPYEEAEESRVDMSIIGSLSTREQKTLQMRIDGLTFAQISESTGEPQSRLLIRMHRIKKLLTEGVKNPYKPKR